MSRSCRRGWDRTDGGPWFFCTLQVEHPGDCVPLTDREIGQEIDHHAEPWFHMLSSDERTAWHADAQHRQALLDLPADRVLKPGTQVIWTDEWNDNRRLPATVLHYSWGDSYGISLDTPGVLYCNRDDLRVATPEERARLWHNGHPIRPGQAVTLW